MRLRHDKARQPRRFTKYPRCIVARRIPTCERVRANYTPFRDFSWSARGDVARLMAKGNVDDANKEPATRPSAFVARHRAETRLINRKERRSHEPRERRGGNTFIIGGRQD